MRMLILAALALASSALWACGSGDNSPAESSPISGEATRGSPADSSPNPGESTPNSPAETSPIPGAATLNPSIEQALSCRVPPVRAAKPAGGGDLQRYDLTAFPQASCNDGSPAVLYFRPYEGAANRNKWIIALNGGGGCGTAQDCANRWCGVDTNFDADNMSTKNAGNGLNGDGILERQPGNPFANYNQVEVRYCTSDSWQGHGLGLTTTAKDPKTGKDVTFQINFAGGYVFQAVVDTLRQDGVEGLVYSKSKTALPDLDDASEVVLAGGSAGGNGVIFNLDRLADELRGGSNKPVVRGFIEAIVGPDKSKLDYSSSVGCKENQLCSFEAQYKYVYAKQQDVNGPREWTDESCLEWHKKNEPGTEWLCYDLNHVLANHVTTPYFVRTGLADQLRSSETIEQGYSTPDGKPLTVLSYAQATAEFVSGLQAAVKSGHEASNVTKLPGVFAPSCRTHYTLFQTNLVNGVTVEGPGAKAYSLFDVWNNWVAGEGPDVVVTSAPRTDNCTGE